LQSNIIPREGMYKCQEYTYYGGWLRGLKNGAGLIKYSDGSTYTGAFWEGSEHGYIYDE